MTITPSFAPDFITPYESGNRNQTTQWEDCIRFYQELAQAFPETLHFIEIGQSDAGRPLHAGVITSDGEFDRVRLKAQGRPVFFNNKVFILASQKASMVVWRWCGIFVCNQNVVLH